MKAETDVQKQSFFYVYQKKTFLTHIVDDLCIIKELFYNPESLYLYIFHFRGIYGSTLLQI